MSAGSDKDKGSTAGAVALPDVPCPHCDGTGKAVPDCETCEGNGWVEDPDDGGTMTCPDCNDDKCDHCNGEGYAPQPPAKAGEAKQ